LQRSLQKGLKALLGENSDNFLQLGQATNRFFVVSILLSRVSKLMVMRRSLANLFE